MIFPGLFEGPQILKPPALPGGYLLLPRLEFSKAQAARIGTMPSNNDLIRIYVPITS